MLVDPYRDKLKKALEIIAPAAERRADCERDIVDVLRARETLRGISSRRTPAQQREHLQKLAKTLRAAIDLGDQLGPYDLWWDEPVRFDDFDISSPMRDPKKLVKEIERRPTTSART